MLQKGKMLVFLFSALVVLYGVSAAFYPKLVSPDETFPALRVFMDSLGLVNKDYVEAPDMSKVQEGAMRGLIEALDPHSSYLTSAQLQAIEAKKSAAADVGVVLSKRANIICVVATERNGAAAEAGMRPGDYLVSIDGVNVEDRSIPEAESLLRGDPGSSVKATVFRGAQTKPVDIEMIRKADLQIPVGSRMLDGHVGLLEVASLADPSLEQTRIKLKTLISAGAQKILLDLRDCADGRTANGAELANYFLKSGTLYSIRGREKTMIEEIAADSSRFITDLPLVVLINASTAGPAEITAGALKAAGRALLVGEKSFGMGSHQKRIEMKSGSVLILSTAKFYTPDGKMIENDEVFRDTGIKPNIESPDQDRLQDLLVDSYFDEQEDAVKYRQLREKVRQEQLDRALEILAKSAYAAKQAA